MLRRYMLRYRIKNLYVAEAGLTAVANCRRILTCLEKKDDIGIEAVIRETAERLKKYCPDAVLITATNPVDPLNYVLLWKIQGRSFPAPSF